VGHVLRNFQWRFRRMRLRTSRQRPIPQIDDSASDFLTMLTNNSPSRQTNHNKNARGNREYHSRPTLPILRLYFWKIAVARTASAQMVQIFLRFRERHPVLGNRRDRRATWTPYTLRIRKLFPKPSTERGQNIPLFLRCVCFLVQTSLTLTRIQRLKLLKLNKILRTPAFRSSNQQR
jgi:hypothetical protein